MMRRRRDGKGWEKVHEQEVRVGRLEEEGRYRNCEKVEAEGEIARSEKRSRHEETGERWIMGGRGGRKGARRLPEGSGHLIYREPLYNLSRFKITARSCQDILFLDLVEIRSCDDHRKISHRSFQPGRDTLTIKILNLLFSECNSIIHQ